MEQKSKDVFVFINQLYYGKVKWPFEGESCPAPNSLRMRLTDNKGKVGFLGSCKPERVFGYGSTSAAEGRMWVMSLGITTEYTLIDNITVEFQKNELNMAIRKEA